MRHLLVVLAALAVASPAHADTPKEIRERHKRQFEKKVTPYDGWAIPEYIVMCESGGDYHAVNPASGAGGAYQIMPATWRDYGGKGLPQNAKPKRQHIIARRIWKDRHEDAWSCA